MSESWSLGAHSEVGLEIPPSLTFTAVQTIGAQIEYRPLLEVTCFRETETSRLNAEPIVSGGNIKGWHDISDMAFSVVRVCPLSSGKGKSFDLMVTSDPEAWVKVESKDLCQALTKWNWRTAQKQVKDMLTQAGFANGVNEEVKGSVRVIEGSLAGPKGTILERKIESLNVLHTASTYLSLMNRGRPDTNWVRQSSLKPCEEIGTQAARAPTLRQ